MLIFDLHIIGANLLDYRKQAGMTQAEVAEAASLSDRTYADIERGKVNMRLETLLCICQALCITPNDILTTRKTSSVVDVNTLQAHIRSCPPQEQDRLFRIIDAYLP